MSNGTITKHDSVTSVTAGYADAPLLQLLTAMGHGNGSGPTEEFTNLPGRPHVLRAKNFGDPALSTIAKLNLANAAAHAAGGLGVLVDADMLPYDASQVTFYPDVHVFREFGNFRGEEYEIEAYGATTGGTDPTTSNWFSVEACYAAADANNGTVRFSGIIGLSRPWVPKGDVRLIGVAPPRGHFASNPAPPSSFKALAGGPALLINADNTFGPLSASLVSGVGNSFGNGTSLGLLQNYINLRDISSGEINNISTFCYEFFFKTTNIAADYEMAVSTGVDFSLAGHTAFRFLLLTGGQLRASATIGGVVYTINSAAGAISANTVYWTALTYDGSTLRLFFGIPGATSTLAGSAAASGNWTQSPFEEIYPFGTGTPTGMPGYWDSIRLTRFIPRYTTTGTVPSAKFSADGNTIVVLNFDLQDGVLTRGQGVDGDSWFWERKGASVAARCHIENVGFITGGLVLFAGQGSTIKSPFFGSCRDALTICDSIWATMVDNPYINIATRHGISVGASGPVTIISPILANACGAFGITVVGGVQIYGGYVVSGQNTVCQLQVFGSAHCYGLNLSSENSLQAGSAVVYVTGELRYFGGEVETAQHQFYVLTSTVGARLSFNGTIFSAGDGLPPTTVISSLLPLTYPVAIDHCSQSVPWVPWADRAGAVVLGRLGKGDPVTFSQTPTFDCSVRDSFELSTALTANLTGLDFTNRTPSQLIGLKVVQDGGGGKTINKPAYVHGDFSVDSTAGNYTLFELEAGLDSASAPGLWVKSRSVGT